MDLIAPDDSDVLKHVTEDAVAQRFATREAERLRYCHDAGAWFHWDGAIWRRDRMNVALQRARGVAREAGLDRGGTARAGPGSLRFMIGVERLARGDPAFATTAAGWDADPFLLGTPGGTVRLKTGELVAADPKDVITRATAVAPATDADCPLWNHFLDETTGGDAALLRFLQKFLGYALTGAVTARTLVFGLGSGGNGKSVMMNTVAGILGDYARPASLALVTGAAPSRHARDLAALRGTRLVTIAETEAARPWAEARLKLLTGGDRLAMAGQTFKPTAKLFLVGNKPPILRHLEQALCRRICVVPFKCRPAAPDAALETKLEAEWPGILRWMIEGGLDWQANGLVRPPCVTDANIDYFRAQDLVGHFIEDECDGEPGDWDLTAPAGALFAAWSAYAKAAGARAGSPRTFAEALEARGFERDRVAAGRIFRGLHLPTTRRGRTQEKA